MDDQIKYHMTLKVTEENFRVYLVHDNKCSVGERSFYLIISWLLYVTVKLLFYFLLTSVIQTTSDGSLMCVSIHSL